jgi:hypothetical protein
MVALSSIYASRVRFHLMGCAAGVPAGDRARIEEAINTIPDTDTATYIKGIVDQCDKAYADLSNAKSSITVAAETYSGDINRTVLRAQKSKQVMDLYKEFYHFWVDQLARRLWVPDYTTPMSDAYRYARHGGEYIKSIPGANGRNGDNYWLALNFA